MINIKNNKTKLFIEIALDRDINTIDEDDLKSLESISFVCESENHSEDFDILGLLPNAKHIYVEKYQLTQDDIDKLFKSGCQSIIFKRCLFDESLSIPPNSFRELHFQNCLIENYDSIISSNSEMENFDVNNPYDDNEIDCSKLPESLRQVTLNYCVLENASSLSRLKNLEYLSAVGTSFAESGLEFLLHMPSLDKLYIGEQYKNSDEIKTLSTNCSVKYNFIDLLFDDDEEDVVDSKSKI